VIKDRDHLAEANRKLNHLHVQVATLLDAGSSSLIQAVQNMRNKVIDSERAAQHMQNKATTLARDAKAKDLSIHVLREELDRTIAEKTTLDDSLRIIIEALGTSGHGMFEIERYEEIMRRIEQLKGVRWERNDLRKKLKASDALLNKIRESVLKDHLIPGGEDGLWCTVDWICSAWRDSNCRATEARTERDALRLEVAEQKKRVEEVEGWNVAHETVRSQVWAALGTNWGASIVKTAEAVVAERDTLRKKITSYEELCKQYDTDIARLENELRTETRKRQERESYDATLDENARTAAAMGLPCWFSIGKDRKDLKHVFIRVSDISEVEDALLRLRRGRPELYAECRVWDWPVKVDRKSVV
jgi:hypothetical protein